jgi:hypothetical protein
MRMAASMAATPTALFMFGGLMCQPGAGFGKDLKFAGIQVNACTAMVLGPRYHAFAASTTRVPDLAILSY